MTLFFWQRAELHSSHLLHREIVEKYVKFMEHTGDCVSQTQNPEINTAIDLYSCDSHRQLPRTQSKTGAYGHS